MPESKPKMNQSERNAMVKVVKGRFEAVRRQAKRTRDELKTAIFNRIMEDNARKIAAAERDMAKIEERAQKLLEDARAVMDKHAAEGVLPGHAKIVWSWAHRAAARGEEQVKEVEVTEYGRADAVGFHVRNDWFVEGVVDQVERAYKELEREHGLGELALAKREQELIEEILLGGVNPDAAQEFLTRVPTLDALPSVDEIRQLPTGG